MAQLRIDNVEPSSEVEAIRLVAESLFPASWVVEMAGSRVAGPPVVAVRVFGRDAREVGRGIFQAHHLEDIVPFLNRLAMALVDGSEL